MHHLVELKVDVVDYQSTRYYCYDKKCEWSHFFCCYFQKVSSSWNKDQVLPDYDPRPHQKDITSRSVAGCI